MTSPRLAVILLVTLVVACDPALAPPPTTEALAVEVVAVVDGDTIEVVGRDGRYQVRLDGINAPEDGECYHREATAHLIALLGGMAVYLDVTGIDQFGRTLAHVHLDELHINLDMASRGMAIATTPGPGQAHDLVQAEEDAARLDLGLWNSEACGQGPIPRIEIDFDRSVIDPPGPDDQTLDQELVVLVNREDTTVDLAGWTLRDESSRHRYRFPARSRLGAGESLIVTSAESGWSPGSSPVWNNGGDLILVLDESGRVVARFRY